MPRLRLGHAILVVGVMSLAVAACAEPVVLHVAVGGSDEAVGSEAAPFRTLTRARDEAHRFAISFQRRSRKKKVTRSALDGIPGVGPKRRQALLKAFGSVARIRRMPEKKIAELVGAKVAAAVWRALAKS